MTNPWLVKTNAEGIETPFPSKKAAVAFAKQWVLTHRHDAAVVICRKQKRRDFRLIFQWHKGKFTTERCEAETGRYPKPKSPRRNTDAIDEALQGLGCKQKEARKLREVWITAWKGALERGEAVETPVGTISVVPAPAPRQRLDPIAGDNGKAKTQTVFEKGPKRIRFKPKKNVLRDAEPTPVPVPPAAITPEPSAPVPPPIIKRGPSMVFVERSFWPIRRPYRRY